MTRRHIHSHTALRGIAAILVVFYHLQFGAQLPFAWETATPFFRKGYLWVDLFFILSGFVIAYSARADERAPYDWPQIKSFWIARFARIYPLHFVCLIALLAIKLALVMLEPLVGRELVGSAQWSYASWLNFAEQLFLLNAWGLSGRVGWNIPSWSISAEMFAYFLFPALAAMLVRGGKIAMLLVVGAAIAFYGWIALTSGVLDIVKGFAILRCLAGFSLGIVLFLLRDRFARMPDGSLGLMQFVGLMLAIATMLFGFNDVLAVPGFVLLVGSTWTDRGWLTRALSLRPLLWLGELSYSVYLVHVVLLGPWASLSPGLFLKLDLSQEVVRALVIVGAITIVLIVSMITYRFVELPARKTISRWFEARGARTGTSSLQGRDRSA